MTDKHPRDKHHQTGLYIAAAGGVLFLFFGGYALWNARDEIGEFVFLALQDSYEREPVKTVLGVVVGSLAAWKTVDILNWGLKKIIK